MHVHVVNFSQKLRKKIVLAVVSYTFVKEPVNLTLPYPRRLLRLAFKGRRAEGSLTANYVAAPVWLLSGLIALSEDCGFVRQELQRYLRPTSSICDCVCSENAVSSCKEAHHVLYKHFGWHRSTAGNSVCPADDSRYHAGK